MAKKIIIKDDLFYTIEKILDNYNLILARIEILEIELDEISTGQRGNYSGIDWSKIRVSKTNAAPYDVYDWYLNNNEKYEKLLNERLEKVSLIKKIDRSMDALSAVSRNIIKLKYFDGLSWSEVSYKVNLSDVQCQRLRDIAIDKMKYIIGKVDVAKML